VIKYLLRLVEKESIVAYFIGNLFIIFMTTASHVLVIQQDQLLPYKLYKALHWLTRNSRQP